MAKAKKVREDKFYTPREELANSLTHGAGIILSIVGLVNLVMKATIEGDLLNLISVNVFGASMIFLFTSSTVYHTVVNPDLKHICRVVDHSAIYVLIAGTYTPIALTLLPGAWGWTLFGINWGLAFLGIIFKIFFTGKFDRASTIIYLLMGWLAVVAVKPMWDNLSIEALLVILGGGLCYSLGVIFYRWTKLPYHHAIWHVFVMAGAGFHYFAVYLFTIPTPVLN